MTATLVKIEESPVVSLRCYEPRGTFMRHIYPMSLSIENLERFWKEAKQFRTLFNEEIRGDFKKFIDVFLYYDIKNQVQTRGLFWKLDDFAGVYYMTDIRPGVDALCHVNMLDGRVKGREEITKRLLLHGFEKFGFHRLTIQVPVDVKLNIINFIRDLGFVSEGRLRGLVYRHNKWFDVFSFSIFKDEIKLKR